MATQTYAAYGSSCVIPGVPGIVLNAGQWITIDTTTFQITAQGFLPPVVPIVNSDIVDITVEYGEAGVIPDAAGQTIDAGHVETVDVTTDTVTHDGFLPSS